MRDLREYKEEILRRSEKRIAHRRRRTRRWIGIGASLCLCLIIGAVITLPEWMPKIDGNGTVYENGSPMEPESADGLKHSADKSAEDTADSMAPEAGSSGNKSSASLQILQKSRGYGNFSLSLPENWKYEWKEIGSEGFNLRIAPKSAEEGWLRIEYDTAFGVCGTGLETKTITLGNYEAEQGTYDGAPVWDYIHLNGTPGAYTVFTENVNSWWGDYEAAAMKILESLKVGDGIIHEEEAIRIAKEHYSGKNKKIYADFKSDLGQWQVCFYDKSFTNEDCTVFIDPKGNVVSVGE